MDTIEQVQTPDVPARKPRPPRPVWMPYAIGAAATLIVGAVVAAVVLISAGSDPVPAASFTVRGTVAIDADGATSNGQACYGIGGYNDMREGAQVVVYDAAGAVLARGSLGPGKYSGSLTDAKCSLPFAVGGVAGGHDNYQVEVSHRGRTVLPQARAMNETVTLTLG